MVLNLAVASRNRGKRIYLLVDEVRRGDAWTTLIVRQAWRELRHAKAWDSLAGQAYAALETGERIELIGLLESLSHRLAR